MTTLLDLKKQTGLTNRHIGKDIGRSARVTGDILQGKHLHVFSDDDLQHLAGVLGVTFERCWYAMCESYNHTYGTPGKQHQRASEIQAQAEAVLKRRMPDLQIEVHEPHPLTTVEAVVYIGDDETGMLYP